MSILRSALGAAREADCQRNDEAMREDDCARCYVCNASVHDSCQAIDGEIAECPRPSRADATADPVDAIRRAGW